MGQLDLLPHGPPDDFISFNNLKGFFVNGLALLDI